MKDLPWLVLIVIFLMVPVILTIWHYPSKRLTPRQREMILRYGIIHFTKVEHIPSIMSNNCILPSDKPVSQPEKDMTWFFFCEENTVRSIQGKFALISKIRDVDACVWVYGFTDAEMKKFSYRPSTGYLAHRGEVQKPMIAFKLQEDAWIEI